MANHKAAPCENTRTKIWGRRLLLATLCANIIVLLANLHISGVEEQIDGSMLEEEYFIKNYQTIHLEQLKRDVSETALGEYALLEKIAGDRLSPTDIRIVVSNKHVLNSRVKESIKKIALATYLQGHPNATQEEVANQVPQLAEDKVLTFIEQNDSDSARYLSTLKLGNKKLKEDKNFWERCVNTLLVLSAIFLIIDGILKINTKEV